MSLGGQLGLEGQLKVTVLQQWNSNLVEFSKEPLGCCLREVYLGRTAGCAEVRMGQWALSWAAM
jgi:hypothetical protein